MNNEDRPSDDTGRIAGEYELESGHERRQRLRSERIRKWRKETRHPRPSDYDDKTQPPVPRRFAS